MTVTTFLTFSESSSYFTQCVAMLGGMMEKCIYSILNFSIIFYSLLCFLFATLHLFFTAMKHLSAINRHKQTTLLAGGTQCVIQWCKGVNLTNISVTNY